VYRPSPWIWGRAGAAILLQAVRFDRAKDHHDNRALVTDDQELA
jgi:hypothetical protein